MKRFWEWFLNWIGSKRSAPKLPIYRTPGYVHPEKTWFQNWIISFKKHEEPKPKALSQSDHIELNLKTIALAEEINKSFNAPLCASDVHPVVKIIERADPIILARLKTLIKNNNQ